MLLQLEVALTMDTNIPLGCGRAEEYVIHNLEISVLVSNFSGFIGILRILSVFFYMLCATHTIPNQS